MMEETAPARRRVVLTGISSRAWEHPADRGALTALRELKGFDEVLKMLSGLWNERAWRLEYLGRAIRVDHRQHPRVHRLFAEAAANLDVAERPQLFIQVSRGINGACVGMSRPFIVVTSRAVELYDDDELRFVLGHELGHLLSGHAVYRTMMGILTSLAARLPFVSLVSPVILFGLHEWWRKAEVSADRAGLLSGQDPAASLRAHMKTAGGGDLSEIDTAAFLDQGGESDRGGDLRDSLIKLRMLVGLTHPLPVARAARLTGPEAALRSRDDRGRSARRCRPGTSRSHRGPHPVGAHPGYRLRRVRPLARRAFGGGGSQPVARSRAARRADRPLRRAAGRDRSAPGAARRADRAAVRPP